VVALSPAVTCWDAVVAALAEAFQSALSDQLGIHLRLERVVVRRQRAIGHLPLQRRAALLGPQQFQAVFHQPLEPARDARKRGKSVGTQVARFPNSGDQTGNRNKDIGASASQAGRIRALI
jgi:hypothetical protein